MREDGRKKDKLRPIKITTGVMKHPEGSVLIEFGETKVLCAATVEEKVPCFLRGSGQGWVTAEYRMLPRATTTRNTRKSVKGKVGGRTMEIQRLIGRSLRAVTDLELLGERQIIVDCDVLQADGGTRTASITGAFVALKLAIESLLAQGELTQTPIKEDLAAVSVGLLAEGQAVLDLDYPEDFAAAVDLNLVMTSQGNFVEIQGTGEESTFTAAELTEMLALGTKGIQELILLQKESLQKKSSKEKKELLIATHNRGKAAEFKELFAPYGYEIKTLHDFPEIAPVAETGTTFEENARLKAEGLAKQLQRVVLADDSGLVVPAIDGRPGIYSARFAGEPTSDASNNAKLLHELTDIPKEKRQAYFHCSLVLARPTGASLVVEGRLAGEILTIPRGERGFGYDPLFYVADKQATLAELSEQEKNSISHRGRALEKLQSLLDDWLAKEGEVK